MATIPTYQRQVMPGSADMQVARANTNNSGESPIANALQNIGQQGMAIAGGMIREQISEKKKETEDRAAVDVANVLSQGDVYWQKKVTEATKAWTVGGPDLSESLGKEFDTWREENAAKLPTDASRKYFQQHAAGMKARLQTGVYTYQEKATDAKYDADTKIGMKDDEDTVFKEPHRLEEIYERRMETVIARKNMTEAEKITFADSYRRGLDYWVERGEQERDPDGWYRKRFGEYQKPGAAPAPGVSSAPAAPDFSGLDTATAKRLEVVKFSPAQEQTISAVSGGDAAKAAWLRAAVTIENRGKAGPDDNAVSPVGATGAFQFMESTGKQYGLSPDDRRDFNKSAAAASKFYDDLSKMYGGNQLAMLAHYNGGGSAGRAVINGREPPAKETRDYLKMAQALGIGRSPTDAAPGVQVAAANTGTMSDAGPGVTVPGAPQPPTPPSTFSNQHAETQLQLKNHGETMIRQKSALQHAEMDKKLRDAGSMHTDGKRDPFNFQASDFAIYGAEGPAKFAEYQAGQVMADDIGSFKTMSPDEIAASLKTSQAGVDAIAAGGGTGYATADARQNTRTTAARHVLEMQQKDPQAYAASVGLSNAKPLDFGNLEAFGREIAGRTATASMMRDKYKTPYTLLTNQEASQMAQVMAKFPAAARVDYLNTIRRSVQDPAAYRSVIAQIAPDSPVTAVAGSILAKDAPMNVPGGWFNADVTMSPKAVATTILQGEAILNPAGSEKKQDGRGGNFPMPKNTDMETEFAAYVGNAFRGDPTGYSAAFQAYRAYYAGKASEKGILAPDLDSNISKEALNAVTGGVTDFNGNGQVLKPWGMNDGDFESIVRTEFEVAMAKNGYKGSRMDQFKSYGLQALRENEYLFTNGSTYLLDKTGNPIVANTRNVTGASKIPQTRISPREVTGKVQ